MLSKPFGVAPLVLQHRVQIRAELASRGDGRFRLALRTQQSSIVIAHVAGRQLQGLQRLDQQPFEPRIPPADGAMLGLPAGTSRARHQARVSGELLGRIEPGNGTDLGLEKQRTEGPNAGYGVEFAVPWCRASLCP